MGEETQKWLRSESDRMQRALHVGPREARWDLFDFIVPGDDEQGTLKKRVEDIAGGAFGKGMLTSGLLYQDLTIEMAEEPDAQPDD